MAAVSKAFYDTPNRRGLVLGILPYDESLERTTGGAPSPKHGYPNQWVEIPVLTHLPLSGDRGTDPLSRNHINVLTSDVIVALPGGPGTLSEVTLAVKYERPVIAFVDSDAESDVESKIESEGEPDQGIPGLPNDVPISSSLEGVQKFVLAQLAGSAPTGPEDLARLED